MPRLVLLPPTTLPRCVEERRSGGRMCTLFSALPFALATELRRALRSCARQALSPCARQVGDNGAVWTAPGVARLAVQAIGCRGSPAAEGYRPMHGLEPD